MTRARGRRWALVLGVLALFVLAFWLTGCDPAAFWARRVHLRDIVSQLFPPDWSYLSAIVAPLLATLRMSVTGTALGVLLGLWFGNRERALQVLLFTTLPIAFVAGFSWPVEALPELLQWLRWLLPSTSGVQASLRLNQLGAPLSAALPYLCALVALGAVCTAAVVYKARPARSARAV